MIKIGKNFFFSILFFILAVSLISCGKNSQNKDKNQPEPTETDVEQSANPSSTEEPDNLEVDSKEEVPIIGSTEPVKDNKKEILIYSVDDDTLEKESIVAHIPEDSIINPEFIVKEVTANFQETIGVSEIIQVENKVIVSFQEGLAPLARVSSSMETVILDCIAYSLLDNIEECTEVIFRGENGKNYESGHILLDYDEVYAWE